MVALDEGLDLDAGGSDERLAGSQGLAKGVVFIALENLAGNVEEGYVFCLTVGDGALVFEDLSRELGAFRVFGMGGNIRLLVAGFTLFEANQTLANDILPLLGMGTTAR